MKTILTILFSGIFLSLLYQTIVASLDQDVITVGAEIWAMPWGRATLMDAYFGFITFFIWLMYKENSAIKSTICFLFLMIFGNFFMSAYMLIQLRKLKTSEPWHMIFLRNNKHEPF